MKEMLRSAADKIGATTGVNLLLEKLNQTRKEQWPGMDRTAKAGALAANAISFARLFREFGKALQDDSDRDWIDTVGDVTWAFTDGLDGQVARRSGGKTAFGGAVDSLVGDKWARWVKEVSMAKRGRMSWVHPAIRMARDLTVTLYREQVTQESGGKVNVDASPKSDILSGKYSTANYFATNTLLDSPLGNKMPRWARETVATVTDLHLVATGIANIYNLKKSAREVANDQ